MATKFADIAKAPKDVLGEDYASKVSLKCKKSAGPVAVTIETERASDGALSSKVGTKFAYSGLSFDKLQVTANGGHVVETSLVPAPGLKVSFKGNKGADLGVDYKNGGLFATGVLDVKDMSKFSTSACLKLPSGIMLGGDVSYALSGKAVGFTGYNAGAAYSTGPMLASLSTTSKFSQLNLGLLYKVNKELTIASQTTHSSAKPVDLVAFGGEYTSPIGTIKAKVNMDAIVAASYIKEIAPKVTLTASASVAAKDMSNFKYGIGIVM